MIKIALVAVAVVALSFSAVMAGSCPGGGCGDKDKEGTKDGEKKSLTVEVAL